MELVIKSKIILILVLQRFRWKKKKVFTELIDKCSPILLVFFIQNFRSKAVWNIYFNWKTTVIRKSYEDILKFYLNWYYFEHWLFLFYFCLVAVLISSFENFWKNIQIFWWFTKTTTNIAMEIINIYWKILIIVNLIYWLNSFNKMKTEIEKRRSLEESLNSFKLYLILLWRLLFHKGICIDANNVGN